MRVKLHYVDSMTGEASEQVVDAPEFTPFGVGRGLSDADFVESGMRPDFRVLAWVDNGDEEAAIVVLFPAVATMGAYLLSGIAYLED